jgi:glutathione synthase/RimK-type ligase-like ATP-grasp enzyme
LVKHKDFSEWLPSKICCRSFYYNIFAKKTKTLMLQIALATCARLPELNPSDQALIPAFAQENVFAEPVIWDNPEVDWTHFDAIIIRNIWDYYEKYDSFLVWLEKLKSLNIKVLNSPNIILENSHKFYLRAFEQKGIAIIPTLFSDEQNRINSARILAKGWAKFVVKPAVSAGSYLTEVFENTEDDFARFNKKTENSDRLIQPFMPEILVSGEVSLIFIGGEYSHAIVKLPTNGDFRVQRQFGGQYRKYQPADVILETAKNIIATINQPLLFGRVDGIIKDGRFLLMELELIEPDLYFEHHEAAVENFVKAALAMI